MAERTRPAWVRARPGSWASTFTAPLTRLHMRARALVMAELKNPDIAPQSLLTAPAARPGRRPITETTLLTIRPAAEIAWDAIRPNQEMTRGTMPATSPTILPGSLANQVMMPRTRSGTMEWPTKTSYSHLNAS